jgi:hypothetical protein
MMKKTATYFLLFIAVLACAYPSTALEQRIDPRVREEVDKRLKVFRKWAADPILVQTIRKANARPQSSEIIKDIDEKWQSTSGIDEFMRSLLENSCAERLRSYRSGLPEIAEAFVTDRTGANIAMTNKTSDYWQGDETKFTKAFSGGGAHHIDPVSFDESIQAYAVQIALPVMASGEAIGVLVLTLNLEKLERTW